MHPTSQSLPFVEYHLGMSYLAMNNRNAALEQYRILQTMDASRATKLFNHIK